MTPSDDQKPKDTAEADSSAGVSCAAPAGSVGWTSTRPKEEGFYWYREPGSPPEVILWDHEMQWVRTAGNDIPWGDDMSAKIEGEFWPEKLTPPNADYPHQKCE
jgi:hypothetical protein